MQSTRSVDVSAILAAVYRPAQQGDQIASRVRARLALIETLGEGMRLLFEAPAFALLATLNPAAAEPAEDTNTTGGKA